MESGGFLYVAVMVSAVVILLLFLIIIIEVRMSRIFKQLNEISKNAAEFVKIGLTHFKKRPKE